LTFADTGTEGSTSSGTPLNGIRNCCFLLSPWHWFICFIQSSSGE